MTEVQGTELYKGREEGKGWRIDRGLAVNQVRPEGSLALHQVEHKGFSP